MKRSKYQRLRNTADKWRKSRRLHPSIDDRRWEIYMRENLRRQLFPAESIEIIMEIYKKREGTK